MGFCLCVCVTISAKIGTTNVFLGNPCGTLCSVTTIFNNFYLNTERC